MVGPIVEEVGVEYEGKAVVTKVDVDSNPGTTAKYGIRNIPTILYFKILTNRVIIISRLTVLLKKKGFLLVVLFYCIYCT